MDKKEFRADQFAQLIQITSCMLDALRRTAPVLSKRARYLESAQFLLVMAFEPSSLKEMEEQSNG